MRRFRALVAIVAGLLVAALAGGQALELTRDQALIDAGKINRFARDNLASFSTATLANGIPVIMKRSTANRVVTVKTVLRGGVSFTPVAKAGLEAIMLTMLTRGSQHYSYPEVQRRLFEASASMSAGYQSFDMTSFDLVSIDTYFDDLFPVYADAILHPGWNTAEFPRVISNFKIARQQADADPFSLAVRLLHESFFAGHPYAASWDGAGSSLDAITLDDVTSYYASTVTAGRIFLVAVGDFDQTKLLSELNSTFGTMPAASFTRPPVPSLDGRVKPDVILRDYPQSKGLAYIRGDFAMPGPDSPDYPAAIMAFNLLNDVLFEIVRTRNGASYGASAAEHGFTASYGDITVYKTTVPGKVKALVDQAIAVLASGKSMGGNVTASAAGKSGIGTAAEAQASAFVPIADALPFYKDQYVTQFYSGQQTNTSVAGQIASSVVYHGDYRDYLLVMDRIQAVTADDVVRVTKKYLIGNPVLWIVLGDPALLKDVKRDDFLRFTAN
jgi:zinc protease